MSSLHHQALGISVHRSSCNKCFWGPRDENDPWCWIPFSDDTLDHYKLNHCYMGVYRYLSGGEMSPMEQRYRAQKAKERAEMGGSVLILTELTPKKKEGPTE